MHRRVLPDDYFDERSTCRLQCSSPGSTCQLTKCRKAYTTDNGWISNNRLASGRLSLRTFHEGSPGSPVMGPEMDGSGRNPPDPQSGLRKVQTTVRLAEKSLWLVQEPEHALRSGLKTPEIPYRQSIAPLESLEPTSSSPLHTVATNRTEDGAQIRVGLQAQPNLSNK